MNYFLDSGFMRIFILGYFILLVISSYLGIEFHFGEIWAIFIIAASIMLNLTFLISIGAFFGAMEVWEWNWFFSLLFSAPGILFIIPGIIISVRENIKNKHA